MLPIIQFLRFLLFGACRLPAVVSNPIPAHGMAPRYLTSLLLLLLFIALPITTPDPAVGVGLIASVTVSIARRAAVSNASTAPAH